MYEQKKLALMPLYAAEPAILTLDDFKTAKSVKLSIQSADHVSAERNDSPKVRSVFAVTAERAKSAV